VNGFLELGLTISASSTYNVRVRSGSVIGVSGWQNTNFTFTSPDGEGGAICSVSVQDDVSGLECMSCGVRLCARVCVCVCVCVSMWCRRVFCILRSFLLCGLVVTPP